MRFFHPSIFYETIYAVLYDHLLQGCAHVMRNLRRTLKKWAFQHLWMDSSWTRHCYCHTVCQVVKVRGMGGGGASHSKVHRAINQSMKNFTSLQIKDFMTSSTSTLPLRMEIQKYQLFTPHKNQERSRHTLKSRNPNYAIKLYSMWNKNRQCQNNGCFDR